jgi:DNA polymerase-4
VERAGAATILHADLDAFYASVEQLLDASLRGRPVAVGHGVVLAASYEARQLGVHAGMPGWTAERLCPGLVFVHGHFHEYQRLGDLVMGVFRDFTPLVERISIDEAFLEVAGAVHLFGSPQDIALAIRRRVQGEIGLKVSVGVARTKHLAKVASQVAKPDGLVVVQPDREREFLDPLPVELIWGVGPVHRARLAEAGIFTIGDLAAVGSPHLERMLGRATGTKLVALAANVDPRRVETGRSAGSVGAQAALGLVLAERQLIRSTLGYLADRVASRLRAARIGGRTVTARVRFRGLRSVTRSVTLPCPIASTLTLTEVAEVLVDAALADHVEERHVSLLAVGVSHLVAESPVQLELRLGVGDDPVRPGTPSGAARWKADLAVDAIRSRFGRHVIGYSAGGETDDRGSPDGFRELAERPLTASSTDGVALRPTGPEADRG